MTTEDIPQALVDEFSAVLARRLGLHFPTGSQRELVRGVGQAARAFGFTGPGACAACMRWLLAEPPTRRQDQILATHLAIGETYFFREPAVFRALERDLLPALIAARRATDKRLRIWSAGCSSGEETCSLAMLLARLIPDIDNWSIHLLGTDIDPHGLDKAARGIYRDWSFRGVPGWVRERCFSNDGAGNYTLSERFRRLARFACLNLATDPYPSHENGTAALDLVMCRNVLMYFDGATARTVVQKLHRALVDGGWLIVSQTESAQPLFSGFVPVVFEDSLVYRKEAVQCEAPGPTPAPVDVTACADSQLARPTVSREHGPAHRVPASEAAAPAATSQSLASLARACANAGRLDDARRWCEAAVATDKFDARLRYLLASIQTEQGCAAEAAATLRQALYLEPRFILAHFALGNLYRHDGCAEPAAKHFAIASRLLRACPPESALADADGLNAGRLLNIIHARERTK